MLEAYLFGRLGECSSSRDDSVTVLIPLFRVSKGG
jgi:hypothetical protein